MKTLGFVILALLVICVGFPFLASIVLRIAADPIGGLGYAFGVFVFITAIVLFIRWLRKRKQSSS